MNKYIFIFFFIFLYKHCISQLNIVPNHSFESVENADDICGTNCEYGKEYWNYVSNWDLPERRQFLFCYKGAATPDLECLTKSGLGYDGIHVNRGRFSVKMLYNLNSDLDIWKEMLTVELNQKLNVNTNYYFEFYYKVFKNSISINPNEIGGVFLNEKPWQCSHSGLNTQEINGDYSLKPTFFSKFQHKDNNWVKGNGYFRVDKNDLKWLVIGGWKYYDGNKFQSTFVFDDIKIIDVGPNYCPKEWLFDNMTFNQGTEIYQASERIVIGRGADPQVIPGDVIVKAGSKLVLRAMNIIEMEPGFEVEEGAEYIAERGFSCEENPCTKPKFVDKDIFVCNSREELNVITNLEDIKETWSYKWSNSEQISDPKILNPILYLPSGQGSFKLNLEITTICEKLNKEFTIHYNNNELNYEIHDIVKTQKDLSFKISYTNWCDITINVPEISYSKTFSLKDIGNKFYWEFPKNYLGNNVCDFKDYNVEIKVKSLCTEYQNTENILWNNRKADKINHEYHTYSLITFGNDENRKLWVVGTGMDYFTYELRDRGSQVYYVENVPITSTKMVIFDWEKDKTNRIKGESQYAYILTVKNCRGEQERYNGWVRIYGNTPGNPDELDSLENNYETPIFYKDIEISDTQLKNNAFVKDEYSNTTITIFPNPVISNLTIKSNADTKGTIYIYDNIGKLLFSSEFAGTEKEINLDNFNKGIYHLNFINFKGVEQRFKFIKQ